MHKLILAAALLAVIAIFSVTDGHAAERAASIEYDFIGRPANLPRSFEEAPAGVTLRFLAIKAIDGFRVEAALWQPADKTATATTLIVAAPGACGHFACPPLGALGPAIAAKGYAMLNFTTRHHDERGNTDNFLDIRRDVEAAVYTARALGYRTLILYGQSLGNIHIQYYAANNWDSDLKAVVLTGMFANLPWRSRHMLIANEDTFRLLSEAAFKALREGKERDLLPLPMRGPSPQAEPVTGQHFLSYRAEASSTADGTYWIKRIPRPILMVRDAGDAVLQPFEPYMLLSAATSAGSLVPSIKYVMLPNAKGVSVAAHGFVDNKQPLAETIAAWLVDQHL
jgi:pimeloyl-ACP methyl ester carboxylesterase